MDFPEPLFETRLHERKICLVCAEKFASMVLRTTGRDIVPVCDDCSAAWNVHGYQILRRIKPARLLGRLVLFKLQHPLQRPSWPSIWRDLKSIRAWAAKMKRWM